MSYYAITILVIKNYRVAIWTNRSDHRVVHYDHALEDSPVWKSWKVLECWGLVREDVCCRYCLNLLNVRNRLLGPNNYVGRVIWNRSSWFRFFLTSAMAEQDEISVVEHRSAALTINVTGPPELLGQEPYIESYAACRRGEAAKSEPPRLLPSELRSSPRM